jgi:hypothetical protein
VSDIKNVGVKSRKIAQGKLRAGGKKRDLKMGAIIMGMSEGLWNLTSSKRV